MPGVLVYPNPTTGHLFITSGKAGFQYKICDNIGRQMISGYSENTNTRVSLNRFSAGVYFRVYQKIMSILELVK
ncbi:MAG: T9SS type A sorting domain-containing protein [Bacteroidota bacterium]|nr:T9SS type A sorting domain-containing protein [Bacteroidota bacterium]